jgi:hypothetical protein
MKLLPSSLLVRLIALASLLCPVAALADPGFVTIDFSGGDLRDSSGSILTAGTVLLVADTTGEGFGSFTVGSSLTAGSFLNSYDQVLGTTNVLAGADEGQFIGSTSTSGTIQLMRGRYSTLSAGDALALIWLPDVTDTSTTLNSGQSYGLYTGTPQDTNSDHQVWTVPNGGSAALDLTFITNQGNSDSTIPAVDGNAAFSVSAVPEPADFSVIAGAVGCLAVVGQRYRSRKARSL